MRSKREEGGESDWVRIDGSPIYRLAIRYMIDGDWHPIETVVQFLIPKVHPAKAARRAERARKGTKSPHYKAPEERVKHNDMDRIIRIGARAMAREMLRNQTFEIDNAKGLVRLRPKKLDHARIAVATWENDGGEAAFRDNAGDED